MKYTNKWVVVPYSSITKKTSKNANVADQIFTNKTLTKEEKLANYNNYIIRKLRKKKLNQKLDNNEELNETKNEFTDYDDEDLSNDEDTISEQEFSAPQTPKSNQKSNYESFQESPIDNRDQTMENIQNLSMYNVPASKNTRSMRKISDKTFLRITDNKKVQQKKRKKKLKDVQSKNLKTEFGVIKNWTSLSKKISRLKRNKNK